MRVQQQIDTTDFVEFVALAPDAVCGHLVCLRHAPWHQAIMSVVYTAITPCQMHTMLVLSLRLPRINS